MYNLNCATSHKQKHTKLVDRRHSMSGAGNKAFSSNNSSPTSPEDTRRQGRSIHEKDLRRNSASLDYEVDKGLVRVILSPQRFVKFSQVCKGQETLFGEPNTKL